MVEQEIDIELIEMQADEIAASSPFGPEQARVIACRRQGLSHAETAEVLDKAKGTVRSTWRTCRRRWAEIQWGDSRLNSTDFNFSSDAEAEEYAEE